MSNQAVNRMLEYWIVGILERWNDGYEITLNISELFYAAIAARFAPEKPLFSIIPLFQSTRN